MRRLPSTAAALVAGLLACATLLASAGCQPATAPDAATARTTTEPDFDAGIEAAYLTQATQGRSGAVPLLAGRPALLRIFLRAMALSVPAPEVRATLVETATGAVLATFHPTSPLTTLPTGIFEAARGGSWNVLLPGEVLLPGRHLELEMDLVPGVPPALQQPAFRLPATGSLDVRPGEPLRVTLVPVVQSGLAPDVVTTRTAESWLDLAVAAFPVVGSEVQVAPQRQTSIQLSAGGAGWSELLAELERQRVADGAAGHYLGVVRLASASGTVGRGLIGGGSVLVADLAGYYPRIAAHELGHNLGLYHAPCGTGDEASLDPTWPADLDYADAHLGVFGWDPRSGAVMDPAASYDLMSYCGDDADTWISDFNYLKALPAAGSAAVTRLQAADLIRRPCLLVSGRLEPGLVVLDPAVRVVTVPALGAPGDHRLDLLDRRGALLASLPFQPSVSPAEVAGGLATASFALAIPLGASVLAEVESVLLLRRGEVLARRQVAPGAPGQAAAGAGPRGAR